MYWYDGGEITINAFIMSGNGISIEHEEPLVVAWVVVAKEIKEGMVIVLVVVWVEEAVKVIVIVLVVVLVVVVARVLEEAVVEVFVVVVIVVVIVVGSIISVSKRRSGSTRSSGSCSCRCDSICCST